MRDNTKTQAPNTAPRHEPTTPQIGFETTRPTFEETKSAPLRIHAKHKTAPGVLPVHESASVAQAHTLGTALKTPLHGGTRVLKTLDTRLKSSKESPYHQPLSTTASDTHESKSSKTSIAVGSPSKDFEAGGA